MQLPSLLWAALGVPAPTPRTPPTPPRHSHTGQALHASDTCCWPYCRHHRNPTHIPLPSYAIPCSHSTLHQPCPVFPPCAASPLQRDQDHSSHRISEPEGSASYSLGGEPDEPAESVHSPSSHRAAAHADGISAHHVHGAAAYEGTEDEDGSQHHQQQQEEEEEGEQYVEIEGEEQKEVGPCHTSTAHSSQHVGIHMPAAHLNMH